MKYWLMKTEPEVLSIDSLKTLKKTPWDGVRNYQARNYMRDDMKLHDQILIYHSSCEEPGIYGIARVVRESYPDLTAFDPSSPYFDEKSKSDSPRWFLVDVEYVAHSQTPLYLSTMRNVPELAAMPLLQKGSRLSINPVSEKEFHWIMNFMGIKS